MEPLRVGVVGTGWGELQISALQRVKDVQVVAVCDPDLARAEFIAKQFKIPRALDNYQLLLTANVDWVSIATPPETHQAIGAAAFAAGKHVLCEKPIGLNAHATRALLASAEARGVVHAADFEMRFLPACLYAKELIDEDYLGKLFRVDVVMTIERPWGEHGNWAADDARGGGLLREVGSHFFDILCWWFGAARAVLASRNTNFPNVRVNSVKSGGNGKEGNTRVTADDAFWSVIQFARGGAAVLTFVSGARHEPGWSISATGANGTLLLKSGELWGRRDGDLHMEPLAIPKRLEQPDKPNDPLMWGMVKLMERVAAKIRGGDSMPFPTFRDGIVVSELIDAMRRASAERRWVEVET